MPKNQEVGERETATVTETGPGGCRRKIDNSWGGVLPDGTKVRLFLTAKVQTMKIPVLDVGQVVDTTRHLSNPLQCSVDPAAFQFVSPSKLERRT